jgi:uncharacterized membrane protein YqaE (UPF0057 family)
MKKHSLFFVLLILSGLLLSSCGRLQNMSVTKRHYRSGYYVDFGSRNKDEPEIKKDKEINHEITGVTYNRQEETSTQRDEHSIARGNVAASAEPKTNSSSTVSLAKQVKKIKAVHEKPINFIASNQNSKVVKEFVASESFKNRVAYLSEAIASHNSSSSASETPMWLLIVLCILLPPLAVFLKFGVVDKFWISILLTLLFWLPGVIYALIVVTQ